MKKTLKILMAFGLVCFLTSCPGNSSITYNTIKSANVLLFSFDDNGIYPYLEIININELGIGIYPDSISERLEFAQSSSFINSAFAMEPSHKIEYTNSIDSINVYTIYDFDDEHPAGSSVNDILLLLNYIGETEEVNINELSSEIHHFKFSTVPLNDSLQFMVKGRITNETNFISNTELIVVD